MTTSGAVFDLMSTAARLFGMTGDIEVRIIRRRKTKYMPATCRSCGAEIIWLKHFQTGKANPIDARSRRDGNLVLHPENGTYMFATDAEKDAAMIDALKLYCSHFALCPDADRYRKTAA